MSVNALRVHQRAPVLMELLLQYVTIIIILITAENKLLLNTLLTAENSISSTCIKNPKHLIYITKQLQINNTDVCASMLIKKLLLS